MNHDILQYLHFLGCVPGNIIDLHFPATLQEGNLVYPVRVIKTTTRSYDWTVEICEAKAIRTNVRLTNQYCLYPFDVKALNGCGLYHDITRFLYFPHSLRDRTDYIGLLCTPETIIDG